MFVVLPTKILTKKSLFENFYLINKNICYNNHQKFIVLGWIAYITLHIAWWNEGWTNIRITTNRISYLSSMGFLNPYDFKLHAITPSQL